MELDGKMCFATFAGATVAVFTLTLIRQQAFKMRKLFSWCTFSLENHKNKTDMKPEENRVLV